MIDTPSLTNLPEIIFNSNESHKLDEVARYIDTLKKNLFYDKWSISTKKHIKGALVL